MKLIETFNSLLNDEKYREITEIVKEKFPSYYNEKLLDEIYNWIDKSGVKSIKFEKLNNVSGIAHYNRLILNEKLITTSFCPLIYVLLHETSHYYQFKKHGEEIEYNVFSNENIDQIFNDLLDIEIAADKLAIMKLRYLKKKYRLKCQIPNSIYKNIKDTKYQPFIDYIKDIRKKMVEKNIRNNTELIDLVYNMIKTI